MAGCVKAAFLDDAEPDQVSHAVRDVVERKGGLVSEHLHSRVRFRGLAPGRYAWNREGYVGIYQRTGERDVEVRLILRARWPYRLLWLVALANVIAAVATILTNPPGTVWFLVAFTCAFALLVASILYLNTLRHVRSEERALMDDFETEFQKDIEGASVLDQEAAELKRLELELEGEIEKRRLDRARKDAPPAEKRPRFSLRPGKKPKAPERREPSAPTAEASDDELAARREALLKRKAEIEAKRRDERG